MNVSHLITCFVEPSKLAMDREETPTPELESSPLLSGATHDQVVTSALDGKGISEVLYFLL